MRAIIFKNEINFETIDELIREIEVIDQFETPTKIKYFNDKGEDCETEMLVRKLYFSTNGGAIAASKILVDYINTHNNFYFIFVACEELSSAGFEIFINLECERIVLHDAYSIIHTITCYSDIRENQKKESIQKNILENIKQDIKKQIQNYRNLGICEKSIKKLLKGDDIFLGNDELQRILQLQQS
jgi:hypothetical protein